MIGSDSVMKSSIMLCAACVKAKVLLFTHLPVCSPSHCFHAKLTGVQTNVAASPNAIIEATWKKITAHMICLNRFSGKICRKKRRKDILMKPRVVKYTISLIQKYCNKKSDYEIKKPTTQLTRRVVVMLENGTCHMSSPSPVNDIL